jgi:hypothetical protein
VTRPRREASVKISDFLKALAADPDMQAAWKADAKQCALDFGLNEGQATALAQAYDSGNLEHIRKMLRDEGAETLMASWIKK